MSQVKCADCGCLPEECKNSSSAKACPNCSWDECCCWQLGKNSSWMQTPLHEFGFKCIANEHELCSDSNCKCLCH